MRALNSSFRETLLPIVNDSSTARRRSHAPDFGATGGSGQNRETSRSSKAKPACTSLRMRAS